ncbi:MAG: hypothetical protein U0457_14765 [Candidatus Sericytochromatia bacterium]
MTSNKLFKEKQAINKILDSLIKDKVSNDDFDSALDELLEFDEYLLKEELFNRLLSNDDDFLVAFNIISAIGDEDYHDKLVHIIFLDKLTDDKKAMLIALLGELEFDLSKIDFRSAFKDIESLLKREFNNFVIKLATGKENIEEKLEIFLNIEPEHKIAIINSVFEHENENLYPFLEAILMLEDKKLSEIILDKLSKSNNENIYSILKNTIDYLSDKDIKENMERLIRKMSLKGISDKSKIKKLGDVYTVLASNIDGVGSQSLILIRKDGKKFNCLFLLINEKEGIKDCFSKLCSKKDLDELLAQLTHKEGTSFVSISYNKYMSLLKNILFIMKENNIKVSPIFLINRKKFIEEKVLEPKEYNIDLSKFDLNKIKNDKKLLSETNKILDIEICSSWFYFEEKMEEFIDKKNKGKDDFINDKIKKEFIDLFIKNDLKDLEKRLLLTADFLIELSPNSTKVKKQVKLLLCAALNLDDYYNSPFINEIAKISLENFQQEKMALKFMSNFGNLNFLN